MIPKSLVRIPVIGFLLFGIVALAPPTRGDIPPRPEPGQFVHDLANVISESDKERIRNIQRQAFEQHQTPIVVVTVTRMHDYDPGSPSIESFARRWFDTWGIGSQANNNGVLVVVSVGDRRGRIELGAAWERRFDAYSRRVMDQDMVPRFRNGDYGGGLAAGVESLAEMARLGPQGEPPEPALAERVENHPATRFATEENPIAQRFGVGAVVLLVLAGLGCFVAAYFLPEYRKMLIIAGIALIGLAVFFWIALIVLAMLGKGRTSRRGGGGFGGGGFGGGSSGGGGASGSW